MHITLSPCHTSSVQFRLFKFSLGMHLHVFCMHILVISSFLVFTLLSFYNAAPLTSHKKSILQDPGSSRSQSPGIAANDKSLRNGHHVRLVESSTWTVTHLELQVQPLETIRPVLLVESSTVKKSVIYSKPLQVLQSFETSSIALEPRKPLPTSYSCLCSFLSMLRKFTALSQHTFAKSSYHRYSPCFRLFWDACVLPPQHVMLTCRRIALGFVQNQCSRHDFKVRVSALFTSSVVLAHQGVCTYRNTFCIVYNIAMFFIKKFVRLVFSLPIIFRFLTTRSLRLLLSCCSRPITLSQNSKSRSHRLLSVPTGGGRQYLFPNPSIAPFIKQGGDQLTSDHVFRYVDHVDELGCLAYPLEQGFVYADLTLANIVPHLSKQMIQKIARIHKISVSSHWKLGKNDILKMFDAHNCINCNVYTSVFEARLCPSLVKKESSAKAYSNLTEEDKTKRNEKVKAKKSANTPKHAVQVKPIRVRVSKQAAKTAATSKQAGVETISKHTGAVKPIPDPPAFPPPPLTKELGETIIRQWCKESKPSSLEESGCAVCGELVPISQLSRLKSIDRKSVV